MTNPTPTPLASTAMEAARELTKAQRGFMACIADGQWHKFNGRMEKMVYRLEALGLIEKNFDFCMPGMPTRINVRIKTSS